MGLKIHEYSLERLALGDDDFVDIDYFNGATYETAKIKGQVFKSVVASEPNVVIVLDSSDLPAVLAADTTYIINGEITTAQAITVTNEGSCIIGRDRNKDKIIYTGIGTFITVTEVNFTIRNVQINGGTGSKILEATNYTPGVPANNYGRTKVLQIFGCEIRDCDDVMTITGYELVDINNTLFWYIVGSIGLQFKDVRHLEISSCELFNWYDSVPTYSTASMIELLANGVDNVGFAVININSSIIHPEQAQNGIQINPLSTTRFGTIASNTFINVGLVSGELFVPRIAPGVPDYQQSYTLTFDVWSNQGLQNSMAHILGTVTGNTTDTITPLNTEVQIDINNLNIQTNRSRWSGSSGGQFTYLGTKPIYVSFIANLRTDKQGGGNADFEFFIKKNGVKVNETVTLTNQDRKSIVTMIYSFDVTQTDYFTFWIENIVDSDDMLVSDWTILIKE
tara:strand:+ start:12678 stop:14033 length:1356 start_codon:yes stop_codon:yes gene_type:complete